MKKYILLSLVFIFSYMNYSHAQGWRKGEMEVRVEITDPASAGVLSKLHLTGDYYPTYAILYVTPDETEKLTRNGLEYSIQIPDLNAHYKDFWKAKVDYHSYQDIVDLADSLVDAFPAICMKKMYGTSMDGRELAALKISDNVNEDENEAEVFFDGGIHGDEIGGAENCIRFARDLCRKYGSDPEVTDLIDNREIWIYYMVNPDGRENMSRYNMNGVDLNRDYGFMWDAWGGSTGAYSQVETKSLRNCSLEHQFVVHTTYHSGTEYISCPWSYRPESPPDADHILNLAGIYSSVSGYANMEYGQGNTGMYAINGSTKDGNYGVAGSISWSMEISNDKQPPASQLMMYYDWNYPSMIAMIEHAGYGLEGVVTDAVTGNPVRATVFINDCMQTYTDSTAGDFHKYLLPGKYSIRIVANGYETQVSADSVEVFELSSTAYDFQLVPDDSARWYAWRMISSHIPGNNEIDEGNTSALIGPRDWINYSIGKDGWVVVDMQKEINDLPGNDFKVFEGDMTPEGFSCYVGETMDGPWMFVGDGNGTTEFDFFLTGLSAIRYIKILDDGDGLQNEADAGFDLDAVSDLDHIVGVFIQLTDYTLDDENGNGRLDPDESADLTIDILNTGNVTANNTQASLSTANPYITITQGNISFGTLTQNQSGNGTFSFDVGTDILIGDTVLFNIAITANNGLYNTVIPLQFIVGQFPVLIVDLDGNHNSGSVMHEIMQDMDLGVTYVTAFPDDIDLYQCVFMCLGVYNNSHALTPLQGQVLADYLNNGGRLYMEGGDTWYYDDPTAVHPMFKINGLSDGSNDLVIIIGQQGSFAEGMIYSYEGDNSYIDRIQASDNAFELFRNQVPSYCNAVALDEGTYKTVGCSFELGGLKDSQHTKEELIILILEFFGGILTDMDESTDQSDGISVHTWPNPFSEEVHFRLELEKRCNIVIDIYSISGQKLHTITEGEKEAGMHNFTWTISAGNKSIVNDGMFIYRVTADDNSTSGKLMYITR